MLGQVSNERQANTKTTAFVHNNEKKDLPKITLTKFTERKNWKFY